MNLTDQTNTKIPEPGDTISAGQKTPYIAGIHTDSLSEPGPLELAVIARIPDLDAPAPPPKHKRHLRSRTVKQASHPGRLLSAGLSLNLLVGLGLVLLVGAIAPYIYTKIADNTQSKSDNAMDQAWQPPPPAPTADLAPAWKPSAAQGPSASLSWPNIAESKVPGSPQLLTSINTASTEKDKTTSNPKLNASDLGNLLQRDDNIVQTKITPPPAASRTNETLAADIKAAADKGGGIVALAQRGKGDLEPAADSRVSPWPRTADDLVDFSPWPNPAHPIFAKANLQGITEVPSGTEPSPTRTNFLPAVANRPMVIGASPPGPTGNPTDYRTAEQYNYPPGAAADARQNQPVTADRRNAISSGGAAAMPSKPSLGAPGTAQGSSENEAGTAQFEGMINTTSDRNTYDRSRSSIH
ncbi:MAG: hypothetical protein ABSA16_04860 [Thermoguttaceae bacterium]|jgi:hypothetical protein